MDIYILHGYLEEGDRSDWEVLGVYFDRKQAEQELVRLAGEVFNRYEKREINLLMQCVYDKDELIEIYDEYNYDLDIRLIKWNGV